MLEATAQEKQMIKAGNIPILKRVIDRNLEEAKIRLIDEKVSVVYFQVKAQILRDLLSWIND